MAFLPQLLPALGGILKDVINRVIPDKAAAEQAKAALDIEMAKSIQEGELKNLELSFQDRQSARQREMTVKDWTPSILAYLLIGSYFGLLITQKIGLISMDQSGVMKEMITRLGDAVIAVVSYYFGSSAGSRNKDSQIQQLTTGYIAPPWKDPDKK